MNKKRYNKLIIQALIVSIIFLASGMNTRSQSYAGWYNKAQERIDTLRKGNFGIEIMDKNGQAFAGDVSIHLKKHEYPFGISFDFYEGSANMGNSYSTNSTIQAKADHEIYKVERWNKNLGYAVPVEKGKQYKITLQFAEIYANTVNSRLFNVFIEGLPFLDDYDVFKEAGGQNIAVDTSAIVLVQDGFVNIELNASLDNAAIKGIVVEAIGGESILRINCGGNTLTTADGHVYVAESGYFDPEANTVASQEQWMQATMYKYFNFGVTGNSFKWSGIQPNPTPPNYSNFENALRWTQKVGWDMRGHTLLWGGNDAHSTPDWVRNLPTAEAFIDTCKMRVIRDVSRYKGIIKEYDVVNEPLTGHADWMRNTFGDSIIWNSFKWAHSADPDAGLFVNDYNVEYNWGQAVEYRDLILKMKEMGAPITGVGMQAHFWDCCRPGVDELVKNINIIAEAGLPIRLTEYDFGGNLTEAEQAVDLIKVLTIAFSHPSVNGMISWVLRDSDNEEGWRPSSGYFNFDYTPKLAADTLLYYTQKLWSTHFDSQISSTSPLDFNAYYGDYEIEVAFGDTVKVFTVPCLKENEDSVFTLYETNAKLLGPKLVTAELLNNNSVKLTFDKPINKNTLVRSNFKFFSNTEVALISVEKDPNNETRVMLYLNKEVTKGDNISVSYFPGNLSGIDGAIVEAFGPKQIYNADNTVGVSLVNGNTIKLYPNPASQVLNIDYQSSPYQVFIYNSLGVLVYLSDCDGGLLQIDVKSFEEGLYLVQIRDEVSNLVTKKVQIK